MSKPILSVRSLLFSPFLLVALALLWLAGRGYGAVPIFTTGSTATATEGFAFTYQTAATDNPTLFGATGLPPGLNIDTGTGLISGTPTSSGTFSAALTADNAEGTGTEPLTLTVLPGPTTLYWTGNVSNDWFDGRNWDAQFVPRAIDTVVIGSGAVVASDSSVFAAMTLYGGTITGNLTVSGSMVWGGGTLNATVNISSGGILVLAYAGSTPTLTGTLNNSGLITTGSNLSGTPSLNLGAQARLNNLSTGLFTVPTSYGLNLIGTGGASVSNAGTLRCTMNYGQLYLSNIAFTNTGLMDVQSGTFSSDIGFSNTGTMNTGPFLPGGNVGTIELSGSISGNLTASNNHLGYGTVAGDFSISGTTYWTGGTLSGSVSVAPGGAITLFSFGSAPNLTGTLSNSGLLTTGSSNSTTSFSLGAKGAIHNLQGGLFSVPSPGGLSLVGTTGASFSNAGTLQCTMNYGQFSLSNIAFTNTGLTDVQSGTFSSDIGFSNTGTMNTGPFLPSGNAGTIELSGSISGNLTASNNHLGYGTVAGDFLVSGTMNWTGGTLSGSPSVAPGGAISLIYLGSDLNLTGTLSNSGLVTTGSSTSTPNLRLGAQGAVHNLQGALFSVPSPGGLNLMGTLGASFSNAGTLRCTMNYGQLYLSNIALSNTGLVDIQTGTFSSDIGFSSSGTMSTGAITQSGYLGTIELSGIISGDLTASNNHLGYGSVAGNFQVSGTVNWTGGTLSGSPSVAPGGAISLIYLGSDLNLTGTLSNRGLVTTGSSSSTPNLRLAAQGCLINDGLFSVPSPGGLNVIGTTGAIFSNSGTLRCSMNYGQFSLSNIAFTNTGLVDVQTGTFSSDIGFANSGMMTTGAYTQSGYYGSINLSGTISGNLTASNNHLGAGTIGGNFMVSGTIDWTGGTLGGVANVAQGGVVVMDTSGTELNLTGTLNNSGLITTGPMYYMTPTLHLSSQGRLNNLPQGLFLAANSNGVSFLGSTGSLFSNAGTLRCATGYGTLSFYSVDLANTGWIDLQSGGLWTYGSFSQSAGTLNFPAGTTVDFVQPFQLSGGTLVGKGSIYGSILNTGGTVSPGSGIGRLASNASYIQSGSGVLDLEISGTTPGTDFDQVSLSGSANFLGGTLRVSFINGFKPSKDQVYPLLTYGSLGSSSLTYSLPAFPDLKYSTTFSGTQFTLSLVESASGTWKRLKFGADANNPAVSGDGVVHNGAGLTNLMAYALGLDPFTASAANLPVSAVQNLSGANYLTYSFRRDTTATDLTYVVEASSALEDPNSWIPIATSVNGAPTSGAGVISETGADSVVTVEVRDTQTIDSANHRFMRLRVTH